jgi:hypothetical protein
MSLAHTLGIQRDRANEARSAQAAICSQYAQLLPAPDFCQDMWKIYQNSHSPASETRPVGRFKKKSSHFLNFILQRQSSSTFSENQRPIAFLLTGGQAADYRHRNAIERMFGRLKDFRRATTRNDWLGENFLAAVCLAATLCYWL